MPFGGPMDKRKKTDISKENKKRSKLKPEDITLDDTGPAFSEWKKLWPGWDGTYENAPEPPKDKKTDKNPRSKDGKKTPERIGRSFRKISKTIYTHYCQNELTPRIRLNELTGQVNFDGERLTESNISDITIRLEKDFGLAGDGRKTVFDAINFVAHKYKYNPLEDYVKQCRITYFAKRLEDHDMGEIKEMLERSFRTMFSCDDNEYYRQVSFLFLISLVRRAIIPGCQLDHLFIFEGPQGCGKTQALKTMGGEFYKSINEPIIYGQQKAREEIEGGWIVEIEEFATFKRASPEIIKSFISVDTDEYRKPYERTVTSVKRSCVFVATTNEKQYLNDLTGNRRFIPIKINHTKEDPIDIEFIPFLFGSLIGMAWTYIYEIGCKRYLDIYKEDLKKYPEKLNMQKVNLIMKLGTEGMSDEYQKIEKLAEEHLEPRVKKEPIQDLVSEYIKDKKQVSILEVAINALGYLPYEAGQKISGEIGKTIKRMLFAEGFEFYRRMKHRWDGKSDLKLPNRESVYRKTKLIDFPPPSESGDLISKDLNTVSEKTTNSDLKKSDSNSNKPEFFLK